MFEVGDKVRIVKMIPDVAFIDEKLFSVGDVYTITDCHYCDRYPYILNNHRDWGWCDDELELVEDKKVFTKKDLKTGMFGVMDNNDKFVIVNDLVVYSNGGFDRLSKMVNEDDLAWNWKKINKVFKNCLSFGHLDKLLCEGNIPDLVFDRNRYITRYMTVAEIEKVLGYPVKIVKG